MAAFYQQNNVTIFLLHIPGFQYLSHRQSVDCDCACANAAAAAACRHATDFPLPLFLIRRVRFLFFTFRFVEAHSDSWRTELPCSELNKSL